MPPVYGNLTMINAVDLCAHLASQPLTNLKQMKFSRDWLQFSEYQQCHCGCSFWMVTSFSADGITSTIREIDIPIGHVDIEDNPDNREWDKEIHALIKELTETNKYTKNLARNILFWSCVANTFLTAIFQVRNSCRTN